MGFIEAFIGALVIALDTMDMAILVCKILGGEFCIMESVFSGNIASDITSFLFFQ